MSELSLYTLNKQIEEVMENVNSSNITQLSTDNIEINYDKGIYYVQYTGEDYVLGDVTLRSGNEFIMIVYNSVSGLTNNDTTEKHYYNIDKNNKDKFNSFYYREIILKENIYSGYLSYVFDFSSDPNSIDVTGNFYWTRKINNKDIDLKNIDANTLDGKPASSFALNSHTHTEFNSLLIGSEEQVSINSDGIQSDSGMHDITGFNKIEADEFIGNGSNLTNVNADMVGNKTANDFCNAFAPGNLMVESFGENVGFFKNDKICFSGLSLKSGPTNITLEDGTTHIANTYCRIWTISNSDDPKLCIRYDSKDLTTGTWIQGRTIRLDNFLSTSGETLRGDATIELISEDKNYDSKINSENLTFIYNNTITNEYSTSILKSLDLTFNDINNDTNEQYNVQIGSKGIIASQKNTSEKAELSGFKISSEKNDITGVPFVWTESVDSDGKPIGLTAGQICMILES